MNNFAIIPFKNGLKANFYTIHFEDKEKSETDDFFETFVQAHRESIEIIIQEIIRMKDKRGADYNFFRHEGENYLIALPKTKHQELRLYCIWVNSQIVILGNGGIKNSRIRAYQDDPILKKITQIFKKISQLFDERRENKDIWIENRELKGDLTFKLSDDYE